MLIFAISTIPSSLIPLTVNILFSTSKSDINGDINVYVSSVERTSIEPPLILREKPDDKVGLSSLRVFI